jgi:adenosylcobinamide kinase/adenosylcobinamide-phosphate guanylyltransferase
MIALVTGGSASGKSAIAEDLVVRLKGENRCYLATMEAMDEESIQRIKRHLELRKERGFVTVEKSRNLSGIRHELEQFDVILLECLTNLVANEMFQGSLNVNDMVQKLKTDLKTIFRTEGWLVVVTGDVFGDGTDYEMETVFYQQVLGELNGYLASMADLVIEAVCGIKLVHKGKELLINEGII